MKYRRKDHDPAPDRDADRHRKDARPHVDWGAPGEAAPPADLAPPDDSRAEGGAAGAGPASTGAAPPADAAPAGEAPPSPEADVPPGDAEVPADAEAPVAADGPASTEAAAPADAEPAAEPDAEPAEAPLLGDAAEDGLPPEPAPTTPPGDGVGTAAPVEDAAPAPPELPATPAEPATAPAAAEGEPYVNVLEVRGMDWRAVREAVASPPSGERAERIIARMEERLEGGGPLGLAFEEYAAGPDDRAIQVGERWPVGEVWFVGDVHGDLLALESALQHIDHSGGGADARIVFLGDLFDDGVHAAEVVLRVFELVLDGPMRITIVAGNHDEALAFADGRFQSTVLPSDFTDWLNANAQDPLVARLGRLIIRFFQRAPRALFFPDGLLAAHGGVPHTDLHEELAQKGNWNDPRVLQESVHQPPPWRPAAVMR